jgi:cell division protein FtsL
VLEEESSPVGNLVPLLEKDVLKITIGHELSLRVDEMSRWERILNGASDLGLNHLVEEVPVRSQLVFHAPFVVHIAIVDEGLEMLNVVIVAEETELDNFQLTILNLEIQQLKEHILIKANGLELVWKIVVVGDGEQALHRRQSGHVMDNGVHTGGVLSCRLRTLSLVGGVRDAPLTGN